MVCVASCNPGEAAKERTLTMEAPIAFQTNQLSCCRVIPHMSTAQCLDSSKFKLLFLMNILFMSVCNNKCC